MSSPAARSPRWALSFADLCLLLLGFLILLQARPNGARLSAGMRSAFSPPPATHAEQAAAPLFDPGEALINARGLALAKQVAADARTARITLESRGIDRGNVRLDGWELAAARTAAMARALAADGVPADRIQIVMDGTSSGGQRLVLDAR